MTYIWSVGLWESYWLSLEICQKRVHMYFRIGDQALAARLDSQCWRMAQHQGLSSYPGREPWVVCSVTRSTGRQGSPHLVPHWPSQGVAQCSHSHDDRGEGLSFLAGSENANPHLQQMTGSVSVTRHTKGGNATCGPQGTIIFWRQMQFVSVTSNQWN